MEVLQKHEGMGEELLEEMSILRRQQVKESEAARHRNATLLQDLQKIEEALSRRRLTHPHLLALETRYWVSVEESIPAWEHFLLGKGPHPVDGPGPTANRNRQSVSRAKNPELPPRPKPRTAR